MLDTFDIVAQLILKPRFKGSSVRAWPSGLISTRESYDNKELDKE